MSTSNADKPPVCSPPRAGDLPAADPSPTDLGMPPPVTSRPPFPAASSSATRPSPAPAKNTLLHWVFLLLAIVVICASLSLRVQSGHQVIVPIVNQALPGTCTFRQVTGVPCPGCGLTRSFISLGQGQLREAWRYNPAGLFFFVVVAFQIPYRSYQILRIRRGRRQHRFEYLDNWMLVLLVVVLLVQWVWGLAMRVL